MRALRVRIKLRNELHCEPSDDQVQDYLTDGQGDDILLHKEISAAFRSGEEVRSNHILSSTPGRRE
jgi:hypothetical protein